MLGEKLATELPHLDLDNSYEIMTELQSPCNESGIN